MKRLGENDDNKDIISLIFRSKPMLLPKTNNIGFNCKLAKSVFFQFSSNTHLTLRLHYVPGDHGSHGSPKRSAPCDLVNFCLGTQVLLSIITFRHGLSRYPLQNVG